MSAPDSYDTHCPTCDAPEPTHTPMCAVPYADDDYADAMLAELEHALRRQRRRNFRGALGIPPLPPLPPIPPFAGGGVIAAGASIIMNPATTRAALDAQAASVARLLRGRLGIIHGLLSDRAQQDDIAATAATRTQRYGR